VLVQPQEILAEARRAQQQGHRVGVLLPASLGDTPVSAHAVVRVPAALADYGRSLYRFLRELDERGCDLIIASAPAHEGLGAAIANRLLRAAGPRDDSPRPAFDAAPATPAVASAESGG
jgi:L-threonylcarbamoyladenylate synthase